MEHMVTYEYDEPGVMKVRGLALCSSAPYIRTAFIFGQCLTECNGVLLVMHGLFAFCCRNVLDVGR